MSRLIIIPARLDSRRLPNKPLAMIAGKSLVQHTYELATQVCPHTTFIAVSDEELRQHCYSFTNYVQVTDDNMPTGTHRAAQAVSRLYHNAMLPEDVCVLSLQVDEPCLRPCDLEALFRVTEMTHGVTTLTAPLSAADETNPNVVKACVTSGGCLWFAREMFAGAVAHVGAYCFHGRLLIDIGRFGRTILSDKCGLEQLAWIEHNVRIARVHIEQHPLSINTPADVVAFCQQKEREALS